MIRYKGHIKAEHNKTQHSVSQSITMTLRHKSKAIENLRLANLRDYIITEEESELSPRTIHPTHRSRAVPRRINTNDDTRDDIMTSFRRFTWETPKVDGQVLCNYRRFVDAMIIPTREAIEPWVEWAEVQLNWERQWILNNPVATKREIIRRFEGDDDPTEHIGRVDLWDNIDELFKPEKQDLRLIKSREDIRRGAVSRIGFREENERDVFGKPKATLRLRRFRLPDRPSTRTGHGDEEQVETRPATAGGDRYDRSNISERPISVLGFRDMGSLKRQIVTMKKKALTNPWQKRKKGGSLQ